MHEQTHKRGKFNAYFHSSGARPFLHECISRHTDTQPQCVNESVCKEVTTGE